MMEETVPQQGKFCLFFFNKVFNSWTGLVNYSCVNVWISKCCFFVGAASCWCMITKSSWTNQDSPRPFVLEVPLQLHFYLFKKVVFTPPTFYFDQFFWSMLTFASRRRVVLQHQELTPTASLQKTWPNAFQFTAFFLYVLQVRWLKSSHKCLLCAKCLGELYKLI